MTQTSTHTVTQSAPAPAPVSPSAASRVSTHLKIDQYWYDLTQWKKVHPGGSTIIEHLHGHDATDAFYSLHSSDAIDRLKRLPRSTTLPKAVDKEPPPPTKATLAFRELRAKFEKEGKFERSIFWELFYGLSVYVMLGIGIWCMSTSSLLSIFWIGLAMQQAGWIGHDYTHGRGAYCWYVGRFLSGLVNAFSPTWWSNKHNTHHVFTNYVGIDADIENDPIFHLFFPEPENDVFFRKMQHWYFVPVASFLYVSWRIQSIQYALERSNWAELFPMCLNYLWMYLVLGPWITLGSILWGGCLVAIIVTATHQSEEMIEDAAAPFSYCEGQFRTTRDARTTDPIMEWLWGGMQYQLEHHLFPTMPKYYYSSIVDQVKAFAKNNNLDYRCDGMWQIWARNFNTLKYFASEKPKHLSKKSK